MPITIDSARFQARLRELARAPQQSRRRVFRNFGEYLRDAVRRRLLDRAPRQGELAQSLRYAYDDEHMVMGSGKVWARIAHYGGTIWASGDPNYKAPEPPLRSRRGSVSEVTGKPIKFLAIPLDKAHGGAAQKGMRPRDYSNTFVLKMRKGVAGAGAAYIAQRTTLASDVRTRKAFHGFQAPGASRAKHTRMSKPEKLTGFRLLFKLVRSVTLKGLGYMRPERVDVRTFARLVKDALSRRG